MMAGEKWTASIFYPPSFCPRFGSGGQVGSSGVKVPGHGGRQQSHRYLPRRADPPGFAVAAQEHLRCIAIAALSQLQLIHACRFLLGFATNCHWQTSCQCPTQMKTSPSLLAAAVTSGLALVPTASAIPTYRGGDRGIPVSQPFSVYANGGDVQVSYLG
jgi:hypothetical protein